jgi:hypothetical protein
MTMTLQSDTGLASNSRISDQWLLHQQQKAEAEARVWQRMREQLASGETILTAPPRQANTASFSPRRSATPPAAPTRRRKPAGVLSMIVQVAFVAAGAYVCALAAGLLGFGQFEAWLAGGAGLGIAGSLLMIGQALPLRDRLVEAGAWTIVIGVALSVIRIAQVGA